MGMRILRVTPSGHLKLIDSYGEIDEQSGATNYISLQRGWAKNAFSRTGRTTDAISQTAALAASVK